MPTYEYQCQTCQQRAEAVRRISERGNGPQCPCGAIMEQRIFTGRAFVAPDATFDAYRCVATGKTITSETERRRVMKEHDLVDAREFPEPDFQQMEADQAEFHKEAEKPIEVPGELRDAMTREGHADLLD